MRHDRALARWREAEAIRLRLEGLSYHDIARALGYRTRSAAWKAVHRGLERNVAEQVDTYRFQALVDLEILQDAAWQAACDGDQRAIHQCLRAIDQRVRLAGLYTSPRAPRSSGKAATNGRPRRSRATWREPDEPLVPDEPPSSTAEDEAWDVTRLVVFKEIDFYA